MSDISKSKRRSRQYLQVVAVTILCGSAILVGCGGPDADPRPPLSPSARPAEPVAVVFDVPSLIGKSIDELRQVLGTPQDADIEPTQQQLDLGVDEWSNVFTKDGQNLLVTYNPRTRTVVDLFLEGNNRGILMQRGNLAAADPTYHVEPVRALRDPSQITGVRIIPKV